MESSSDILPPVPTSNQKIYDLYVDGVLATDSITNNTHNYIKLNNNTLTNLDSDNNHTVEVRFTDDYIASMNSSTNGLFTFSDVLYTQHNIKSSGNSLYICLYKAKKQAKVIEKINIGCLRPFISSSSFTFSDDFNNTYNSSVFSDNYSVQINKDVSFYNISGDLGQPGGYYQLDNSSYSTDYIITFTFNTNNISDVEKTPVHNYNSFDTLPSKGYSDLHPNILIDGTTMSVALSKKFPTCDQGGNILVLNPYYPASQDNSITFDLLIDGVSISAKNLSAGSISFTNHLDVNLYMDSALGYTLTNSSIDKEYVVEFRYNKNVSNYFSNFNYYLDYNLQRSTSIISDDPFNNCSIFARVFPKGTYKSISGVKSVVLDLSKNFIKRMYFNNSDIVHELRTSIEGLTDIGTTFTWSSSAYVDGFNRDYSFSVTKQSDDEYLLTNTCSFLINLHIVYEKDVSDGNTISGSNVVLNKNVACVSLAESNSLLTLDLSNQEDIDFINKGTQPLFYFNSSIIATLSTVTIDGKAINPLKNDSMVFNDKYIGFYNKTQQTQIVSFSTSSKLKEPTDSYLYNTGNGTWKDKFLGFYYDDVNYIYVYYFKLCPNPNLMVKQLTNLSTIPYAPVSINNSYITGLNPSSVYRYGTNILLQTVDKDSISNTACSDSSAITTVQFVNDIDSIDPDMLRSILTTFTTNLTNCSYVLYSNIKNITGDSSNTVGSGLSNLPNLQVALTPSYLKASDAYSFCYNNINAYFKMTESMPYASSTFNNTLVNSPDNCAGVNVDPNGISSNIKTLVLGSNFRHQVFLYSLNSLEKLVVKAVNSLDLFMKDPMNNSSINTSIKKIVVNKDKYDFYYNYSKLLQPLLITMEDDYKTPQYSSVVFGIVYEYLDKNITFYINNRVSITTTFNTIKSKFDILDVTSIFTIYSDKDIEIKYNAYLSLLFITVINDSLPLINVKFTMDNMKSYFSQSIVGIDYPNLLENIDSNNLYTFDCNFKGKNV